LLEAVSTVAAGRRYLDADVAQKLALAEIDGGAKSPTERLSARELEVFIRLASGATVQKIADDLKLSLRPWALISTTSNRSSAS